MRKQTKKLAVFLLCSLGIGTVIISQTFNTETITALKSIQSYWVGIVLGLSLLDLLGDAFAIKIFTRDRGGKLPYGDAIRLSGVKTLFNVTTPFNFGGQPFMAYGLSKFGVSLGEGFSIAMLKMLTFVLWAFVGAVIAFIVYLVQAASITIMFFVLGLCIAITAVIYFAILMALIDAGILLPAFKFLGNLLQKLPYLRNRHTNWEKYLIHLAYQTRHSITGTRKTAYFILGVVCNSVVVAAQILLLVTILLALGCETSFSALLIRSALLQFLLGVLPTPGAAGLGEGLYMVLFAEIVPIPLLGVSIVIWRMCLQYGKALIGSVSFFRYLS